MRQSIFSAIPRILMEATGIDFVTRKGRSSSYLGDSREGRGDLHWEGTLRGPWDGMRQEGLKLVEALEAQWELVQLMDPVRGLGHSHRDQSHPQAHPGRTSDRGVTLPARHAGPCPLPPCLPLDFEEYQIHPLSFCDKTTFIFFFKGKYLICLDSSRSLDRAMHGSCE